LFATIWDACSQMDIHIQKLFNSTYRKDFFGKDFITYLFDGEDIRSTGEVPDEKKDTIAYILQGHTKENAKIVNQKEDVIIDDESVDSAIIDFPNFLMHVLKLEYNDKHLEKKSKEIPLNEKYLLDVYHELEKDIKPMYFIECLLFYRTVFDRFVIKATRDEEAEDKYQWTLKTKIGLFMLTPTKMQNIKSAWLNRFRYCR